MATPEENARNQEIQRMADEKKKAWQAGIAERAKAMQEWEQNHQKRTNSLDKRFYEEAAAEYDAIHGTNQNENQYTGGGGNLQMATPEENAREKEIQRMADEKKKAWQAGIPDRAKAMQEWEQNHEKRTNSLDQQFYDEAAAEYDATHRNDTNENQYTNTNANTYNNNYNSNVNSLKVNDESISSFINQIESSIDMLSSTWNNVVTTDIETIKNSWASNDSAVYIDKLMAEGEKINDIIQTLKLLENTYQKVINAHDQVQQDISSSINNI